MLFGDGVGGWVAEGCGFLCWFLWVIINFLIFNYFFSSFCYCLNIDVCYGLCYLI